MLTVRAVAGKGLGVFAAKPISRGTRILADRALITLSPSDPTGSIVHQYRSIPSAKLKSLLSLSINTTKFGVLSWLEALWQSRSAPHLQPATHGIINIFRNNNFDIGNGVQALFPNVARINHSCVPNAQGNFNTNIDAFTIHATRDIEHDEEITISYLPENLTVRDPRLAMLAEKYNFLCACPACSGERADVSEERRMALHRQLMSFNEAHSKHDADLIDEGEFLEKSFETSLAMLETYEAEGIRGREVATMMINVATLASKLGKSQQARQLALKGLQLDEDAVGKDSEFYENSRKEVEVLLLKLRK
ncbi:hypothetical protein CkaCkLH20_05446 [Colletotrichum karsti]|uniref:SET domain-containing protein n=1 Tax=Colletotrichum karsti TaxID=1095194 RepID=A0A9P6IEF8_9PEZI|nr:uncharacterized protein CkaCkLH20_05446 [Colletotrichum karsti]KAF9877180.1 hypothetical protein CkaCkLH20_05446 [Colletotrichum karsti]